MRWLSQDRLPGYIESFHKINLWVRQPAGNQIALALTNSSLDAADGVVLLLRTNHKEVRIWDMQFNETTIAAAATDGPYQKFVLPSVGPWQMRLVVTEP